MGIGWIVKARGLAPSMGAGGTIVASVLCALVVVSALVTFRSWPSGDGPGSDGSLQLRVPEAKAAGRAAPRPAPVVAAARATRRRAPTRVRAAGTAPAPRTRLRTAGTAPAPRARFRGATPVIHASPARPGVAASPAPVAARSPQPSQPPDRSDPVAAVPDSSRGGTVGGTLQAVRQVVTDTTRPVPVPPAVRQPVDQALDTVQGAAQAVDGVTAADPGAVLER